MGAIVSDFPSLPLDADPQRVAAYTAAYADLTRLGLAVPAQAANVVTRAQFLAHLQGLAGAIIKAELAGDPDGVYTGGPTDAQLAQLIASPYTLGGVRRFPGSNATGYQVAAGSTVAGLVLVLNPGLGPPGLLALSGLQGAGLVRFRATAATVANRGQFTAVQLVPSDTAITLATPMPGVPTVGDICDLGLVAAPQQRPRLNQVLAGLPWSPNLLTTADITAAKV